jgi:hypothetical protein
MLHDLGLSISLFGKLLDMAFPRSNDRYLG